MDSFEAMTLGASFEAAFTTMLQAIGQLCGLGNFVGCFQMLSRVQLFVTLWTAAHQGPLSMGFSRQEYWSGLPCPAPGDLPDPGINPVSPTSPALLGGIFTTSALGKPGALELCGKEYTIPSVSFSSY